MFACGRMTTGVRVIVLTLPTWWRTAQCMRRYYNTQMISPHLLNAGKYSSFFLVVIMFAVTDAVRGMTGTLATHYSKSSNDRHSE